MVTEPQNNESLRAQAAFLLSMARSQSFDIQRALSNLHGETALQSRLAAASAQISDVASALSLALGSPSFTLNAADLMSLGGIVQSGDTNSLLSEAAAQAATATSRAPDLTTSAAEACSEVQNLSRDIFDRHIFDKNLHFSSTEDEEAFRRRQADAQTYVDAQLARGTPADDLNASGGMMGVMLDEHTHGAGDSPDFLPRWNTLVEKTERLRTAVRAAGQSTEEFDRNLSASVRSFLKAKGLSDAQIDARLAASSNPLDAAKSLLANDEDSRNLEQLIRPEASMAAAAVTPLAQVEATTNPMPATPALTIDPDAMAARLQAAGLQIPSASSSQETGHGLAVQGRGSRSSAILGD